MIDRTSFSSGLDDASIERHEFNKETVSIWLKGIEQEIQFLIGVSSIGLGYFIIASHNIEAEGVNLTGPKVVTPQPDHDLSYIFGRAVTGITHYYQQAVAMGNVPSESWLVPNRMFNP